MAITGVNAKYISDGEIMIGSLDYLDLISGPHITLAMATSGRNERRHRRTGCDP
jgi:hypothetical protein